MKIITAEMRDQLRKPLPKEAISKHPTKPYLSSIKAIYVVERINDVFGLGSWKLKSEIIKDDTAMIVVRAFLTIPEYGIELESFGGNDNGGVSNKNFDLGDAYKGATTDALTKIGSYLEIGIDVFKGIADRADNKPVGTDTKTNQKPKNPKFNQICLALHKKDKNLKTFGDYNEYCMNITGFELLPANYENIINLIN
jgi:hypothetical protein